MNERIIETVDLGTDESLLLTIDANAAISVGDELVWSISALSDGIVALRTARRTVHIDASDYWRLIRGDVLPSTREAGYLAAQLGQVRNHVHELIQLLDQEELLDNAYYPSIAEAAASLETALGEQTAGQPVVA